MLTRLLNYMFQDLKFDFMYHYLDDVVIYGESFEAHLEYIRLVLDRLRQAELTVKPDVVFATKEIAFLGHLFSPAGVRVDHERTRAIRKFPAPRDTKGVSRLIGIGNFCHKFIPRLADVAAPLNALRKKCVKCV